MGKSKVCEVGVYTLLILQASPMMGEMHHAPEENGMTDVWIMTKMCHVIVNSPTVTASSPFIVKLHIYMYLFIVTESMRLPYQKTD